MSKRASATRITKMLSLLYAGNATFEQLGAASGMAKPTVSAWVRELQRERLIYVNAWHADARGFMTIAAFSWGPGQADMRRPSMSGAERNRLYRERLKDATVVVETN